MLSGHATLRLPVITPWTGGGFHLSVSVNGVAMDTCARAFAWTCVFVPPGWMPGGGIARHMATAFNHLGDGQAACRAAAFPLHLPVPAATIFVRKVTSSGESGTGTKSGGRALTPDPCHRWNAGGAKAGGCWRAQRRCSDLSMCLKQCGRKSACVLSPLLSPLFCFPVLAQFGKLWHLLLAW